MFFDLLFGQSLSYANIVKPTNLFTYYIFQDLLQGDPTKAKQKLGWTPKVSFDQLVRDMVDADIELMKRNPEA